MNFKIKLRIQKYEIRFIRTKKRYNMIIPKNLSNVYFDKILSPIMAH